MGSSLHIYSSIWEELTSTITDQWIPGLVLLNTKVSLQNALQLGFLAHPNGVSFFFFFNLHSADSRQRHFTTPLAAINFPKCTGNFEWKQNSNDTKKEKSTEPKLLSVNRDKGLLINTTISRPCLSWLLHLLRDQPEPELGTRPRPESLWEWGLVDGGQSPLGG